MTYPPQPPNYPPPPGGFSHSYGGQPQQPSKRSRKTLWIVLGVVGALLACGGGFAVFLWTMVLSPDSGPQQIKTLAKDYRAAEDAKNAAQVADLLCSADADGAEANIKTDQKVATGDIDVVGTHTINDVGAVSFKDSKGQGWTMYFRKEGGRWKVCPSAQDEFKAADTT